MAKQREPFERQELDEEIELLSHIRDPQRLLEMPEARLTADLRRAHQSGAAADGQSLSKVYARLRAYEQHVRETPDASERASSPARKGLRSMKTTTTSPTDLPTHAPRSDGRRAWLHGLAAMLVVCVLLGGFLFVFVTHLNLTGNSATPLATVTITPKSQVVTGNALFTGLTTITTSDLNRHEIAARMLAAQSGLSQATGNATGSNGGVPNSVIQWSDIDRTAQPLINQLTTSTETALQKQAKSNERVVDRSLKCQPTVSANHRPGDIASSVTVSASVACTEEVFDFAATQQLARSFLLHTPPSGIDLTGYAPVQPIVIRLLSVTVASVQGQISISVQAAGRWVYQFSKQQQRQIKQALLKQSKAEAQSILARYPGVASASIGLAKGSMMPADASDIKLTIITGG